MAQLLRSLAGLCAGAGMRFFLGPLIFFKQESIILVLCYIVLTFMCLILHLSCLGFPTKNVRVESEITNPDDRAANILVFAFVGTVLLLNVKTPQTWGR